MMYEYLDKVLKKLIREIYRRFQKIRVLPFDELNILTTVNTMYAELEELNYQAFLKIAKYYYRQEIDDDLMEADLLDILRTPSKVMKYSYDKEIIRKRDRFAESMIATNGSVTEVDKAMRYWTQLIGWFAVEVADAVIAKARVKNEVASVVWRSEHDEKTCGICHSLEGRIFRLEELPPKPHPNCRCWTEIYEYKANE